ncbi:MULTISPECIES: purine nucleoside permease [Acetobacter]|uniref:purine-nucleoside phosphorylase n=1 Tax=Acetobacter TaxID=434 RepID=UPI002585FF65|nr:MULTISPECIES: purine nucleoside permease [Acetobacter]MCC6105326.1 purine nucleoside permease [Acetobacter sp.]MDN7356280.1 purine nucleoside permease [Acetobacter senegalensis]
MRSLFRSSTALFGAALLAGCATPSTPQQATGKPWDIRAVVLTTYEIGQDSGDRAGEFQPWVEGEKLSEKVAFPAGVHDIYTDPAHHILYVVTGTTLSPAASSVMALGFDPRFDLSKAYWVVSAISGFDQQVASVGSVSWADYVVSDISKYIDPREAPKSWPYGYYMITAEKPNQYITSGSDSPDGSIDHAMSYKLNPALVKWAYDLTKDLVLEDSPALQAERKRRVTKAAKQMPSVVVGGDFAADAFWHGKIMTQYARDWVKMLTQNQSQFVESNMEDAGIMEAMKRLTHAGRADINRVLISRSASNYTEQAPGQTAVQSANDTFSGEAQALENGYRVAAKVLHEIVDNWPRFENGVQ